MNKAINSILLAVFLPTLLFTIYVGYDLPVDFLHVSGSNIPYRFEIFLLFGTLIFLLIARRSIKRWMGAQIVKKTNRFKWNVIVGEDRVKRVMTYLQLEALIMIMVGIGLYLITPQAWAPAIAFAIGGIDGLVFGIIGKANNWFRIGLSTKALIVADREVTLLYFTGLRKVTVHQQSIYFDYIKGLQLSFPTDCIPPGMEDEFFHQLENCTDKDKVFFIRKNG